MDKSITEQAGYLVTGAGIEYLINNSCTCCPDHNRYLEVDPYNPKNLSSVSMDISVGQHLWEFKDKDVPYFDSKEHTIKKFLDKYTHQYDLLEDLDGKLIIHKDQFLLLEVLEEIHFNRHISGHVLGKSSIGRLGLIIQTASIINPMQMQKLVLEIKNISPITLIFHHGTPIAQIQFFFFPHPVERHYQQYGLFK